MDIIDIKLIVDYTFRLWISKWGKLNSRKHIFHS